MSLPVKIDEDLPEDVGAIFAAAGYSVSTVRTRGLSGITDQDLWVRIQAEGRWLVTADKDFGDIRRFGPRGQTGIVLFRAEDESRRRYLDLAGRTVRSVKLEDVAGCLVVVGVRGVRIRRIGEKN